MSGKSFNIVRHTIVKKTSIVIKRLLAAYYQQVWNKRDLRLLPYLFADECKVNNIRDPGAQSMIYSLADIKRNIQTWMDVFPDVTVEVKSVIHNDLFVSVLCRFSGHHLGAYQDILPTGNQFTLDTLSMHRVSCGKICEQWIVAEIKDVINSLDCSKTAARYE